MQPLGRSDEILSALSDACKPAHLIAGESDVETRLACVESVIELAERLPLTVLQRNFCFEILLRACGDYKTDKRGDTGSWCRSAAVQGMERLLYVTFRNKGCRLRKSDEELVKEHSKEDSSSVSTQTVMTSYGLGNMIDSRDNENKNENNYQNENENENRNRNRKNKAGVLIKYHKGTLGHRFALNSFQVHSLPEGVLSIHKMGVKPLPFMGTQFDLLSLPPVPHYVSSDTDCVAENLTHKNESILNNLKETHVGKKENIDAAVDVDVDVDVEYLVFLI